MKTNSHWLRGHIPYYRAEEPDMRPCSLNSTSVCRGKTGGTADHPQSPTMTARTWSISGQGRRTSRRFLLPDSPDHRSLLWIRKLLAMKVHPWWGQGRPHEGKCPMSRLSHSLQKAPPRQHNTIINTTVCIVCMTVCNTLHVWLSGSLQDCLCGSLFDCLHDCMAVCMPVCPFVSVFVLAKYLSVCGVSIQHSAIQ